MYVWVRGEVNTGYWWGDLREGEIRHARECSKENQQYCVDITIHASCQNRNGERLTPET
jgi:hypothetical protein